MPGCPDNDHSVEAISVSVRSPALRAVSLQKFFGVSDESLFLLPRAKIVGLAFVLRDSLGSIFNVHGLILFGVAKDVPAKRVLLRGFLRTPAFRPPNGRSKCRPGRKPARPRLSKGSGHLRHSKCSPT